MTLLAILGASLLGSGHCGAMCGVFVLGARQHAPSFSGALAYHVGRGLAYLGLGVTVAVLAAQVDGLASRLLGLQRLAGIVMGAVLVVAAMVALGLVPSRFAGRGPGRAGAWLRRALAPWYRQGGVRGAAMVGLLSALLPCGWLWGFVALAAAGADWRWGLAAMAVFWLGTLPALALVAGAVGPLATWARRVAPRATAWALLFAGVLAISGKLLPDALHAVAPADCVNPAAGATGTAGAR